jgi:DNA-binding response OmpR family regulator
MLTVLSEPGAGYGLGADDYLIKPFQKEALLKTLQNLVASHKASSPGGKPEKSEKVASVQIH